MIDRICIDGPFGDETSIYNVKSSERMTVAAFLAQLVKTYPKEWGSLYINGKEIGEYRCGTLLFDTFDVNEYLDCLVISIEARGGWGLMDYHIYIGEKYNLNYVLGTHHGREMNNNLVKLLDEIQTYGVEVEGKNIVDNEEVALFLLRNGVIL